MSYVRYPHVTLFAGGQTASHHWREQVYNYIIAVSETVINVVRDSYLCLSGRGGGESMTKTEGGEYIDKNRRNQTSGVRIGFNTWSSILLVFGWTEGQK